MRHTPEQLLDIIYTYYTRGQRLDDPRWADTPEHHRLVEARLRASQPPDYEHWRAMLGRLKERFPNTSAENWSFHLPTGDHDAGYIGELKAPFMNVQKGECIGILVSFLVPYYVIYSRRLGYAGLDVHLRLDSTERSYAEGIATEIEEFYPGYEPMPPEVGTVLVPDVPLGTGAMGKATIYDCLFSEHARLVSEKQPPAPIITEAGYMRNAWIATANEGAEGAAENAETIYAGARTIQAIVWHCVLARHRANVLDSLRQMQGAVRELIPLTRAGLVIGGPAKTTEADLPNLQKLITLVEEWLASGIPAPELEETARQVYEAIGGEQVELPPWGFLRGEGVPRPQAPAGDAPA